MSLLTFEQDIHSDSVKSACWEAWKQAIEPQGWERETEIPKFNAWYSRYEDVLNAKSPIDHIPYYLCNDQDEFPAIIEALENCEDDDMMVDSLTFEHNGESKEVIVWEPLVWRYSVGEFCEMIGLY